MLAAIVVLIVVYKKNDPSYNEYFPKCMVKSVTGYDCPGCGSQRAIHSLLNFRIVDALKHNALTIVAIPYLLLGFTLNYVVKPNKHTEKIKRKLFGNVAIYIVLAVILGFWMFKLFW